jgi:GNAT superfamily N-acetyltransferase
LKKGCRAFVLIKNERIIGDIWYVPPATSNPRPHEDLDLLGIDLGPTDVYAFDMHVSKHERGKDLATSFMGSVLRELRGMGYTRAYGYYLSSNIPALWIHRLIGYKEMPGIGLKRFAFYRRSVPKTGN